MKLIYSLSSENYQDYASFLASGPVMERQLRRHRLIASGVVLLLGVVLAIVSHKDILPTLLLSAAGSIVLYFLFPVLARGGSKLAMVNAYKVTGEEMTREQTLLWEQGKFILSCGVPGEENYAEKQFSCQEVLFATEYKTVILLTMQDDAMIIIPVAAFESPASKDLFLANFPSETDKK